MMGRIALSAFLYLISMRTDALYINSNDTARAFGMIVGLYGGTGIGFKDAGRFDPAGITPPHITTGIAIGNRFKKNWWLMINSGFKRSFYSKHYDWYVQHAGSGPVPETIRQTVVADRWEIELQFGSKPISKKFPLRILAGVTAIAPYRMHYVDRTSDYSIKKDVPWRAETGVNLQISVMMELKSHSALNLGIHAPIVPMLYGSDIRGALPFPQEALGFSLRYWYFFLK